MKATKKILALSGLFMGVLAASPAHAHRTYNSYGYATAGDGFAFSTGGNDGLWDPNLQNTLATPQYVVAPAYSGGSGPSCGSATTGACPPATAGGSFYRGSLPVSWMAAMHAAANTGDEVFNLSTADALAPAPAGGAAPGNYQLAVSGNTTGTGLDFGYIRVDHPQNGQGFGVQVTVSADAGSLLKPYVALYSGWDHSWGGANGSTAALGTAFIGPSTPGDGRSGTYAYGDNPLGSDLVAFLEDTNPGLASSVSFFFQSSQLEGGPSGHYTLVIGGVNGTSGLYTVRIQTVSIPGGALSHNDVQAALDAAISESGGKFIPFDENYFAKTYSNSLVGYAGTPLQYYVEQGAAKGFNPNAWFNADYYRATYKDIQALHGADLLTHYAKFGVNEGRSPSPALNNFDGARYLLENPDVNAYVQAYLNDFRTLNAATGQPVSDAQAATQGAIAHYIKFGAAEGRVVYDTSGVPISFTM